MTLAHNNNARRIVFLIIHISAKCGTVNDRPAKLDQPL